MASQIFLTGATGYLGGEVLFQLSRLPEKHKIRCLVRSEEKAVIVRTRFPEATVVIGDLDDVQLIEEEAKAANVVFHLASTRHEASSRAIASGLSDSARGTPGYWIQISGASLFSSDDVKENGYGMPSSTIYDEAVDADKILQVIQSNPARIVDNLVISQDASRVKTALIIGPMIYGNGRGLGNTASIQGPGLVRYALTNGHGFQVGQGQSTWSNIHVQDLGELFVLLLKAAVEDRKGFWARTNLVLPENGEMSFGEIAQRIAASTKKLGLTTSDHVESVTVEKANEIMPHGAVLLGTNARLKCSRTKSELGWTPKQTLEDNIADMVAVEAQKMQE